MSTARTSRRTISRLPRARREADIMAAAERIFCEKGYGAALTAEIAEAAGVVEGTIYRYFPTKRDLLIRVVERWYERILADYDVQLRRISGTWNRLRFMIWRHLAVLHSERAMCRLVFDELRHWPEYRQTVVFDLNRRYTQRTLAIIEEGIASGELGRDVPLRIVRDMIYGGIEHHAWAYLRGEGDYSPEAAADAITELVYRGLAAAPSARVAPEPVVRLEQVAARLERLAARRGTGRRP
jgi:AcrR family transcriptional regulator